MWDGMPMHVDASSMLGMQCRRFLWLVILWASDPRHLRCADATAVAADPSAIRLPATETQWHVAPLRATRAYLFRDRNGVRRATDVFAAATAATALLLFALLCYRTLRNTRLASSRKLARKESDDDCVNAYNDTDFPYFEDNFFTASDMVSSDKNLVLRGPRRKAGLLSDCYLYKGYIPNLILVRSGNTLSGERSAAYVTEKGESLDEACRNLNEHHPKPCPAAVILPAKYGKRLYFEDAVACYPECDDVRVPSTDTEPPNNASLKLCCPLNTERQRIEDIEGSGEDEGVPDKVYDCFFHGTCGNDEQIVVMTAGANDTVTVLDKYANASDNTSGLGLFKVECRSDSDIIKQLGQQSINSMIKMINNIRERRWQSFTAEEAGREGDRLIEEVERLNNKTMDLLRARGNSQLEQAIMAAWDKQSKRQRHCTDWELCKMVDGFKRTQRKLRNEVRRLMLKLYAAKLEGNVDIFLKSVNTTFDTMERKTLDIASAARGEANKALDYDRRIGRFLGGKWSLLSDTAKNDGPVINPALAKKEVIVLSRYAVERSARILMEIARGNLEKGENEMITTAGKVGKGKNDIMVDARQKLSEAEERIAQMDRNKKVLSVMKQVAAIINPCSQPTSQPRNTHTPIYRPASTPTPARIPTPTPLPIPKPTLTPTRTPPPTQTPTLTPRATPAITRDRSHATKPTPTPSPTPTYTPTPRPRPTLSLPPGAPLAVTHIVVPVLVVVLVAIFVSFLWRKTQRMHKSPKTPRPDIEVESTEKVKSN